MGSSAFITKRTKVPGLKNPKEAGPNLLDSQYSAQPLAGQPDAISPPIDTTPSTPSTPPPSVGSSSVGVKPTGVGMMSSSSAARSVYQIPENNLPPNISTDPGKYVPDPEWKPGDPRTKPPQPAINQPLSATVNATGSTEVAGLPGKKKYGLLRSRFLSSSGLFRTLTNGPQGVTGGADGLLTPTLSGDSKPTLG